MDSTPSYWVCTTCLARNLNSIRYCVGCDSRQPTPGGGGATGYASPHSTSRDPRLGTSPLRYSPRDDASSSVVRRYPSLSPADRTGLTSALSPDASLFSPRLSPPIAPRASSGGASIRDASRRLEEEAQRIERDRHREEVLSLQGQLNAALTSHRGLMSEFQRKSTTLQAAEADVELLSKEVESLRAKLTASEGSVAAEIQKREAIIGEQSQSLSDLTAERDALLDRLQSSTLETAERIQSNSRSSPTPAEQEVSQLKEKVAVLDARYVDSLATVTKLNRELDEVRSRENAATERHSLELQKSMQDALTTNETIIQKVTNEFASSKAAAAEQHQREVQRLTAKAEEAMAENTRARNDLELQLRRAHDQIDSQQTAAEKQSTRIEELNSEGRFQLEIIADLKAEKAGLTAELTSLKDALANLPPHLGPNRDSSNGLLRPSVANVSHNYGGSGSGSGLLGSNSGGAATGTAMGGSLTSIEKDGTAIALQEALDEANTKLQSATFEVNELRKQLVRAQEALKDRDGDLEDANTTIDELERALENEKQNGHLAQKDIETLENKLQEQTAELHSRLESSNQQNKDIVEQNNVLREKADATDLAMKEMEQALADAVAALPGYPSQGHPAADVVAAEGEKGAAPEPEPAPPEKKIDELTEAEKDELTESFNRESKALKVLSFAQKRVKAQRKP